MSQTPTGPLADHLEWLGLTDCPCDFAWKSLGRLDGVGMGHGWVRMNTVRDCPHHGAEAVAAWYARQRRARP